MTLLITQPRSEPFKKDLPQFSITSTIFLCATVFAPDVSDGKESWISVNFYKAICSHKGQICANSNFSIKGYIRLPYTILLTPTLKTSYEW